MDEEVKRGVLGVVSNCEGDLTGDCHVELDHKYSAKIARKSEYIL